MTCDSPMRLYKDLFIAACIAPCVPALLHLRRVFARCVEHIRFVVDVEQIFLNNAHKKFSKAKSCARHFHGCRKCVLEGASERKACFGLTNNVESKGMSLYVELKNMFRQKQVGYSLTVRS